MENKKSPNDIVAEMTDIVMGHLEAMPVEERKQRTAAFKEVITRDEKPECARPKAASSSRTGRYSRRIPV